MIIVTGGAGFIGSALLWGLNKRSLSDIILVDEATLDEDKKANIAPLKFSYYLDKDEFLEKVKAGAIKDKIDAIIHMGACSDTTEKDEKFLRENNYEYTKALCGYCARRNIRFIYASSAATYGDGSNGYSDDEDTIDTLRPLNPYGNSKQLFDKWARGNRLLGKIVGLKYFNVFGPNEYHKGEMRSVALKAFYQVKEAGKIRLFKSHRKECADGEQKRDFLYIKDAVRMTLFFLDNKRANGIYNIGTGIAHTWNELAGAIFKALGEKPNIEYFDMPQYIKDKYQYFTRADITKLQSAGYKDPTTPLGEAVADYIKNYLIPHSHLG